MPRNMNSIKSSLPTLRSECLQMSNSTRDTYLLVLGLRRRQSDTTASDANNRFLGPEFWSKTSNSLQSLLFPKQVLVE
jgi:hypothetical protein